MYIAVSLLHTVAVDTKLYPGVLREIRRAFFNLNLVSLIPEASNGTKYSRMDQVKFMEDSL